MQRFLAVIGSCVFCLMFLAACSSAPELVGDPQRGKVLFEQGTQKVQACSSCHSVDGTKELGPSLQGIATTVVNRVSGQTASQYLQTSIRNPNAYVLAGYAPDVMVSYAELSDQQVSDLVAYLLTLK